MQLDFSPSINIVRDVARPLDYIATPNAKRIYQQILDNYVLGLRSFSIIGSYGTGKSAFLIALEQTLNGFASHFASPNGQIAGIRDFRFVNVVGTYTSLVDTLPQAIGAPDVAAFWQHFEQLNNDAQQNDAVLVIVLDEFGKFLEYAAQSNPERELDFIQQLAEYANDVNKNVLLLVVLHQSFYSYAAGLDHKQQDEWEKVKGRLKELTFNEPVEQLLELAASFIANRVQQPVPSSLSRLVSAIKHARAFSVDVPPTNDFAARLLPLDLLAASVLTHALQHYGQNERSLFTFLRASEYLGLSQYDNASNPYYNLACVYDYLLHNYYSLLNTAHNPHYAGWGAIRRAVERVEYTLEHDVLAALKLVKTIGLLNIFAAKGARVDDIFLDQYAELALAVKEPKQVLRQLEERKIIRYVSFKETYVLFDGTDLDIEHELQQAESSIDSVIDIVPYLRAYFEFPYYGWPRCQDQKVMKIRWNEKQQQWCSSKV